MGVSGGAVAHAMVVFLGCRVVTFAGFAGGIRLPFGVLVYGLLRHKF